MEELRMIRALAKSIEAEYGVSSGLNLAERLVALKVTELTDEIKDTVSYLQQICVKVDFDDYNLSRILGSLVKSDVEERYQQYVRYTGKEKCKLSNLTLSCERVKEYDEFFQSLGFNREQQSNALEAVLELGVIAKYSDDAKKMIDALSCFELSDAVRNQFISENADYLFNDYSRDPEALFASLREKFGSQKGFEALQEHPEWIRFGK